MSAPSAPSPVRFARYRLVVRSAAEAVALVRERFGSEARVVSVRQIEAGGLARFLQKPRLEVIVEVGTPGDEGTKGEDLKIEAKAKAEAEAEQASSSQETAVKPSDSATAPAPAPAPVEASSSEPIRSSAGLQPYAADATGSRQEISLLRALGFDDVLLERIRADEPTLDWNRTAPTEALARLAAWLRRHYGAIPRRPAGPRRVFLGACGTGKTTAMCKMLSSDVFVRRETPAVLKLDGDHPNATDGLAAFCDVLGAPLLRSAAETCEFERDSLIYVDVPGVGLDAHGEQARLAQMLDALWVDTRVLVVNASCETEVISANYELGRVCGATHVVFTHVDELRRPGKLWRFILFGGLRPLMLATGPSPAGEVDDDVFGALLARTFPPGLARFAGVKGGRP